ncbi:MAG TPA: cyclase family protein, partial [Pyrinomonadaceae bacterium]
MPIYDISLPLCDEIPIYPGDPGIEIRDWFSMAQGDSANVSVLRLGAHTGTHVDAPAHFIEGAPRVESLSLDALIGEALVVEVAEDRVSIDEDFVIDC